MENTKTIIIVIICIFSYSAMQAQENRAFPHSVGLYYFGENRTHPGFSVTADYLLNKREKHKNEKVIDKLFSVGMKIGAYHHSKNHKALFIQPFLSCQRIGNRGFLLQIEIGSGYLMRHNDGITYQVNRQEEVETIETAIRHKFMPSLNGGIGYNFHKKFNLPLSIQVKTGIFLEIPNNHNFLPHKFTEMGLSYLF